jgi:Zn ribbon nucleic-acid-binding protein
MTDRHPEPPLPVVCPNCLAMDKPHAKPVIEVNNGTYTCVACGHSWRKPVHDA